MAPSKRSKAKAVETSAICRKCLSADGTLESVTSDERGEYLLQQTFSCTNVQMKVLPTFPTYLCSACKSRSDFLDKLRSIWILNNARIERFKEEVDTTDLPCSETTAEHSDADMQRIGGVGSVVKTEVVAEDSEEDYQSSQTVSNSQQISSTYDYNHHDDLFEAEEESLETLLKREPMDDQQQPQPSDTELKHEHNILKTEPFDVEGEASVAGKTITGPDDPASFSDHNNLVIKYGTEAPKWNQKDPNSEEKSGHPGNQSVSAVGERRLLRSNKRRSSQKDIAAAEFLVSTKQNPKVNRNVHKNKQKHQCPHCSGTYSNTSKLKIHIRTHTGEKPFPCKVCGKTFHTARNQRAHEQIHNKDQHKCPHCPGKFALQSYLKDHIRTHTGEKPFMCKVCSKTFHAARNLRLHMQIHDKHKHNIHNKHKHQCPHCSGTYPDTSKLKIHIRTHTGEKPFQCEVCSKAFHTASILRAHKKIHNKDQHQCPQCSHKCALRSQLEDHIRTHTGEKPFQCKVCSKAFHAANNLHIHMQIHNQDQHQCPQCSHKCALRSQLKDHIRTHTGEKPFQCKVCSKAFHAASILRVHTQIHNKDQHKCPHCLKKFALQSRLKVHIRTHTGEKPFQCKVCSKAFHAANNLHIHLRIHNKDQHQCPQCSHKFALRSSLIEHIRTHTGEKPFMCKVCSKTFHAARNLRVHMLIHNKDQHKCPHCLRKFALRSQLKDHIRTHTGEQPFMCKVCSKTFQAASNLRKHMQIHNKDQHKRPHCIRKFALQSHLKDHIRTNTGEKPFPCKVCGKTFHAARNLRKHMQIHNKDQHQCPHCSAKFAQQYQLKIHIRLHTGETPFPCKVCGKKFHAKSNLKKHMKIHNKDLRQSAKHQQPEKCQ